MERKIFVVEQWPLNVGKSPWEVHIEVETGEVGALEMTGVEKGINGGIRRRWECWQ